MSDLQFGMLSGAAWGLIAQLAFIVLAGGSWHVTPSLVPFVGIGAALGLLVTRVLRGVSLAGGPRIALVSLVSLAAATAAFGFVLSAAGSIAALMAGVYQPGLTVGPLLASFYWVWGLFATGLVVGLWPLSIVNHWALSRRRDRRGSCLTSE